MNIGNIIVSSKKLDNTLCDNILPGTPVSSTNKTDCKDIMLRFWCLLIKTVTVLEFHVLVNYDYYNIRVVGLYGYLITSMIHYPTYPLLHEEHILKTMHYTIATSD